MNKQQADRVKKSEAQVLSVIIVAPITEEILFRGMILSRLKKAMNPTVAIIISSLAFGVIHGHPIWSAYAFVCGIIFAVVAESSKSIVASILLHMAFNSVSIIGGEIEFSDVTFVIVTLVSFALLVGSGMYVMKKDKSEVVT